MMCYIFCVIRAACARRGESGCRDRQESQAQEAQWVRDNGKYSSVYIFALILLPKNTEALLLINRANWLSDIVTKFSNNIPCLGFL